jgi:hypothetical protein
MGFHDGLLQEQLITKWVRRRHEIINVITQIWSFWVVTPCDLVITNILEEHAALKTLKLEAAGSSKTLVSTYRTTHCHNIEDPNLIYIATKSSDLVISVLQEVFITAGRIKRKLPELYLIRTA